jgi:hypothetical protein
VISGSFARITNDGNEFIFHSGHAIKRDPRGNPKCPALGRQTKKEKRKSMRLSARTTQLAAVVLCLVCVLLFANTTSAQVGGAIQTTTSSGTTVNGNLYKAKTDVYLNGGPQNMNNPGLVPNGNYYFQVTNPSGSQLLSADDISCRQVIVQNGRIIGVPGDSESPFGSAASGTPNRCTAPGDGNHPVGTFNGANNEQPVQLCPAVMSPPRTDTLGNGTFFDPNNWCDTTSNPGGEYKAWLTPQSSYSPDPSNPNCSKSNSRIVFGFCDSDSKTDNFKVQFTPPPPCNTDCAAPGATLVACKYWDKNDDGAGIPDMATDIPLGGWTINASTTNASLSINSSGPSASGVTDNIAGCTTFTITGFLDTTTPASITLSEVQQANWNQVGPLSSTLGVTYTGGSGGDITAFGTCQANILGLVPPCTSTISVPLIGDGSTTVAPDFGNTGLDLTVTKTATPGFTRTYAWSIAKCAEDPNSTNCVASPTKVDQVGSTVTFTYKVTASETGFQDSAYKVTGTITVNNPNSFAVSPVTITENGDGVGTCNLDTNGMSSISGVTIAASGSASYTYTCTYGSTNPVSGTNKATADWSGSNLAATSPDTSMAATQGYSFAGVAPTTLVDNQITVTDCFNSPCPTGTITTLGSLTASDTMPFTTHTYTYTHTVNVPHFGCVTYPNIATILVYNTTTILGTASASVEVCGPEQTGALTMGFWQNKNGQGIITSSGPKTGICTLTAALRVYNPFQDLSATATCSQAATYVYNVIKAATCGGSTCNAMLKAQMLATALDVYFGKGPGGNPIGASTVIGNDVIDLTKICEMIDGSGGTATCSSSSENASSAFGGATSATVSQLLTYAASQSNVGGGIWYANVKTTQVLAKDTFDAINNQVAFAP